MVISATQFCSQLNRAGFGGPDAAQTAGSLALRIILMLVVRAAVVVSVTRSLCGQPSSAIRWVSTGFGNSQ